MTLTPLGRRKSGVPASAWNLSATSFTIGSMFESWKRVWLLFDFGMLFSSRFSLPSMVTAPSQEYLFCAVSKTFRLGTRVGVVLLTGGIYRLI